MCIRDRLYASGSGGLFGKGLGESIQKLGFVPEAQNDMIFSIICEELGLFGAISLILIFVFMIYRFMLIASNAPDLFGALLVVGVMSHIAIQAVSYTHLDVYKRQQQYRAAGAAGGVCQVGKRRAGYQN